MSLSLTERDWGETAIACQKK